MWCRHGIMYLIPQRRLSSVLNLKFTCCRFCFIFCLFFHLSLIKYNMMCRYFMNAESYHRVIRIVDGKKKGIDNNIRCYVHPNYITWTNIYWASSEHSNFFHSWNFFHKRIFAFQWNNINILQWNCLFALSLSFHLNMDIRIISVFVCCCFFLFIIYHSSQH